MPINPLGKTLDQVLAAYGAKQVSRETRVDVGGQRYERLEAQLESGGTLSGKIVPNGAGQLSWLDVVDATGQRSGQLTFGKDGKVEWADTFEYSRPGKNAILLGITTDWDKQRDGEADGREIWKKGEGTHREIDTNGDGHIDTVGPTRKDR